MELKCVDAEYPAGNPLALIEPYGIEISQHQEQRNKSPSALIEPYGIEIKPEAVEATSAKSFN